MVPTALSGAIRSIVTQFSGTFLHLAHEEGWIRNTSIHAGIRAPLVRRKGDMRNDIRCGFLTITARDIDRLGVSGVTARLQERVGKSRVYGTSFTLRFNMIQALANDQYLLESDTGLHPFGSYPFNRKLSGSIQSQWISMSSTLHSHQVGTPTRHSSCLQAVEVWHSSWYCLCKC